MELDARQSIDESPPVAEELELVAQLKAGDGAGLERLMSVYGPTVMALLRKKLPGSPSQHECRVITFLAANKVFEHAADYDPAKSRLSTWFFAVARNTAIEAYRQEARACMERLKTDPAAPLIDDGCTKRDLLVDDFMECLEQLGPVQRRIAHADLLAGDEADAAEIAMSLGISKQTVYSYRHKYRVVIRKRMQERGYTTENLWRTE